MRGTAYAVAEIILWMLAAAAVGFIIGWIVRGWQRRVVVSSELTDIAVLEQERRAAAELELHECQQALDGLRRELEEI